MARQRTPRPAWRQELRSIKDDLARQIWHWRSDSQVWVDSVDRKPGDPYTRPREAYEYPENSPEQMKISAAWLHQMATRLDALAYAMESRAYELERAQRRAARESDELTATEKVHAEPGQEREQHEPA